MRPLTGARADRFSAALARVLTLLALLLAALGGAALAWHTPFPAWAWVVTAPDMLALTVLGALRAAALRPSYRPFGS